jgi:hypothetical protein
VAKFRTVKKEEEKEKTPLITIGDALSSFLHTRDEKTENLVLVSREELRKNPEIWDAKEPREWRPQKMTWFTSAPLRRWAWSLLP